MRCARTADTSCSSRAATERGGRGTVHFFIHRQSGLLDRLWSWRSSEAGLHVNRLGVGNCKNGTISAEMKSEYMKYYGIVKMLNWLVMLSTKQQLVHPSP